MQSTCELANKIRESLAQGNSFLNDSVLEAKTGKSLRTLGYHSTIESHYQNRPVRANPSFQTIQVGMGKVVNPMKAVRLQTLVNEPLISNSGVVSPVPNNDWMTLAKSNERGRDSTEIGTSLDRSLLAPADKGARKMLGNRSTYYSLSNVRGGDRRDGGIQVKKIQYDSENVASKSMREIQKVERQWLDRLKDEKERHRTRERDQKDEIVRLSKELHNEQSNLTRELVDRQNASKTTKDLKKKVTELTIKNSHLKKHSADLQFKNDCFARQVVALQAGMKQVEDRLHSATQKLHRNKLKHQEALGDLEQKFSFQISDLQDQIKHLQELNKQLEIKAVANQGTSKEESGKWEYDGRVRRLLSELEEQSRSHIGEINQVHEYYRPYVTQCKELEEKCEGLVRDADFAVESERAIRKEFNRLQIQNESLLKRMKQQPRFAADNKVISNLGSMKLNEEELKKESTPFDSKDFVQARPLLSQELETIDSKTSGGAWKRKDSTNSVEQKVLSDICDNIHNNQSCLNPRIRRMFSLQDVLVNPDDGEFFTKPIMMEQLLEYDNLIKAIGALSFVQHNMANIVPLCFRAWKERVFERRANRILDILSSHRDSNPNASGVPAEERRPEDEDDGLIEADEDYEEYFFKDQGETDQYVKVIEDSQAVASNFYHSEIGGDFIPGERQVSSMFPSKGVIGGSSSQEQQQNYHILPMDSSNFYYDHNKYNNGRRHHQSSSGSDEQQISIQEDNDDEEASQRRQKQASQKLSPAMGEHLPEVENAKLLQKHAEMQGVDPSHMFYK